MRTRQLINIATISVAMLALSACGGDLAVESKSFDTPGPIVVVVAFNKAVDRTTVTPQISLILAGATEFNAKGTLTWDNDQTLRYTTASPWTQVVSGNDRGFSVTLAGSIRAKDGGRMEECATGKPVKEPPGNCVLQFSIPG
jgi:hypothetical protein